jgi:hypothetical protein
MIALPRATRQARLGSDNANRSLRHNRTRHRIHPRHRPGDRNGTRGGGRASRGERPQRIERAARHGRCATRGARRGSRGARRRHEHRGGQRYNGRNRARRRHSRQQPRHLRRAARSRDRRRRVAALLRRQRAHGCAPHPPLPAGNDAAKVGPRAQHRERLRRRHPCRDGALRGVEDRTARRLARLREGGRRYRRHRQLGDCGAHAHEGRRRLRLRARRPDIALGRGAARVHGGAPATVAAAAPHRAGGDRQHGGLPELAVRLGDPDGGGAPGAPRARIRLPYPPPARRPHGAGSGSGRRMARG